MIDVSKPFVFSRREPLAGGVPFDSTAYIDAADTLISIAASYGCRNIVANLSTPLCSVGVHLTEGQARALAAELVAAADAFAAVAGAADGRA